MLHLRTLCHPRILADSAQLLVGVHALVTPLATHRNRTAIAHKLEESHLSHQSNMATGPRAWGAYGQETVAERKPQSPCSLRRSE